MGTAKASIVVFACLVVHTSLASADECTGHTEAGSPFATCFDAGNRLYLGGGTGGIGGGIRLRHAIEFDDEPDLSWKLEHRLLEGMVGGLGNRYQGVVYAGRYLRHARDGHLVVPLGVPRKVFAPFDIGAEAEVGRVQQERTNAALDLGVVRVAGLIDLSRSADFRRRLSLGVVASWNMQIDSHKRAVVENRVAPLSMLSANGYLESKNGLSIADIGVSGGREWSSLSGWQWKGSARLSFERVVLALNDRPLSVLVEASANALDAEITALLGARFSLFSARGQAQE